MVLLVVGLAACGTYRWEKDGKTDRAEFQRESQECQQQVGGQQQAGKQWENCMMGRGWRFSGSWF
jgi:hypothetical protein